MQVIADIDALLVDRLAGNIEAAAERCAGQFRSEIVAAAMVEAHVRLLQRRSIPGRAPLEICAAADALLDRAAA
ncbi:MAG: hypothetical protein WDN04_13970 [Rhodospirillales bacterium]